MGELSGAQARLIDEAAAVSAGPAAEQAVPNSLAATLAVGIDYPLPTANSMPSQETSPKRLPVP